MYIEKDLALAICAWGQGKNVIVMDLEEGRVVTMDEFMANTKYVHFLVDAEEAAAQAEESIFDEVPPEALADPGEDAPKMSRAEKRHMIETLAAEGTKGVSEIAAIVGCSVNTVRKYIK